MHKLYSVSEIAEACGITDKWVRSLGPELIAAGHAQKVGKVLVCHESAIGYIKNRADNRGRPKTIHLRTAGDMGKTESWNTFCRMTGKPYKVTDDPKAVTCKKCLKKMVGNR